MTRLAVLAVAAIVAAPNALAATAPPRKGHHHHQPRTVQRQIVDPCRSYTGVLPAACLAARR